MKIAIIGAGNVGGSLGQAFGQRDHDIRFGVRDPSKAADLVAHYGKRTKATDPSSAAAFGEVVFLTVPWGAALTVVGSLGDLEGKILADCTNPMGWDNGPIMSPDVAGTSGAQLIAAKTSARVVKAFSTHGWELNLNPQIGDTAADAYVCGDDAEAKATIAGLCAEIGFHTVDVGPLRNAGPLENLAVLWVHLAVGGTMGRKFAFKLIRG